MSNGSSINSATDIPALQQPEAGSIATEQPTDESTNITIQAPPSVNAEVKVSTSNNQDCPPPPCPVSPQWWQTALLGGYLLLIAVVIGYLLLKLWVKRENGDELWLFWGLFRRQLQEDTRLLAIVMVSGALGGFFHAAKSFSAFAGNQRIYMSWVWWYLTRPFSGVALATIFYFFIRGGLLTGQTATEQVSIYGMAAIAGLAGMFADQAALKLKEVFNNLFNTEDPRANKLDEPAGRSRKPTITTLSKTEVKSGIDTEITISGTGFNELSAVSFANKLVQTTFVSPSELKANLKASDLTSIGVFDLLIINPPPAGASDAVKLKVIL